MDIVQLLSNQNNDLILETHYNTAQKSSTIQCLPTNKAFPFDFVTSDTELTQGEKKIQRQPLNLNNRLWPVDMFNPSNFIIRSGDINNDGFFDLIVDGPGQAVLLTNYQCANSSCGTYNAKFMDMWSINNIRMFRQRSIDGMNSYNSQICDMSFFDIEEDGRLDLMTNLCNPQNSLETTPGNLMFVLNSLSIDAFFIKISVLDNPLNQSVNPSTLSPYLNTFGAHSSFFTTALNGAKLPTSVSQLSHPGVSLQLPYMHTGLGRTNNYV